MRDSGPWMHDGRAQSLRHAIRLHGGEATEARTKYVNLNDEERLSVVRFLESLVAPGLGEI